MQRGLILVTYYARTIDETRRLLDAFDADTNQRHDQVLVVDNAASLNPGSIPGERFIQVIRGTNNAWEFSGWLEGLKRASDWPPVATITLLNDSYQRNWTVTPASRGLLRAMYQAADVGRIAGLLDNFSWIRRPRFSRRPNSRLVVIPGAKSALMTASLQDAIYRCRSIVERCGELFDQDETRILQAWIASQSGRWEQQTLPARLQRIFIEFHLFDGVPSGQLLLLPSGYFASVMYALARHIFREKR